ncbi:MAG: hypothetical protein PHX80_04450 [Candidatus Nanoarchaeia archaeon]|nr:hypothetical protein [Candidatus Nanoarchaeia archaeon]
MIKKFIEQQIFAFGFLPLLLVMEILQDEEKYELCAIILQVLNEHSEKYGFVIPKQFSEQAVEEMKYNFMKYYNLSGDITYRNNTWYAANILTGLGKLIRRSLHSNEKVDRDQARIIIRSQNNKDLTSFDKNLQKCMNSKPKNKT